MNWFLMLMSAVAGGVVTWLWSVRKVRRQIPVYEPAPTPTAESAAAAAGSVPAAVPLVAEQGMLSGLDQDVPAKGTRGGRAAVADPSPKPKPPTEKKAAAPPL